MITLRDIQVAHRLNAAIQHIEQGLTVVVNAIGPFPGVFPMKIDETFEAEISIVRVGNGWGFRCKETGEEAKPLQDSSVYAKVMLLSSLDTFFSEWKGKFSVISDLADKSVEKAENSLAAMKAEIGKKGA